MHKKDDLSSRGPYQFEKNFATKGDALGDIYDDSLVFDGWGMRSNVNRNNTHVMSFE